MIYKEYYSLFDVLNVHNLPIVIIIYILLEYVEYKFYIAKMSVFILNDVIDEKNMNVEKFLGKFSFPLPFVFEGKKRSLKHN